MPWSVKNEMDERLKFVAEALSVSANMSEVCRKYGISRSLGYKVLRRYEQEGLEGLSRRSRRPRHCPGAVSGEMVCEIVRERKAHPRWGGKTIRAVLLRRFEQESVPSVRTIERVLERSGLVSKRRRRSKKYVSDVELKKAKAPNEVWTVDFKGQWRMRNGKYCFPLTIRDEFSRYILDIGALGSTGREGVRKRFEACFERYGLPQVIRSDNGTPFASIRALSGLSRLSVWWVKLGIYPNRIQPSSPQQNGAHERMHLDMSKELELSPQRNLKEEQKRFEYWREEYNRIRPHQALSLKNT